MKITNEDGDIDENYAKQANTKDDMSIA